MSRKDRQQPHEKKPEPATEPALTTQEQPALDALQESIPVAESKRGPTAEAATEALLESLLDRLADERDGDEAPVALLERILRERAELQSKVESMAFDREDIMDVNHALTFDAKMPPTGGRSEGARVRALAAKVKALEAQLQPAHNALGKHANARGVLLSHVAGSGPSYDVGGRYRLALVTVKDGEVSISEAADVVAGVASHEMPFGLVRDHMEKRMEDYLTPEAHRS